MTGAALHQKHHGTVVEASGQMDAGAIDFSRKLAKTSVKVAELTCGLFHSVSLVLVTD